MKSVGAKFFKLCISAPLVVVLFALPLAHADTCETALQADSGPNSYIALKRSVGTPVDALAESSILENWVDVEHYPPIRLDDVFAVTERPHNHLSHDVFMTCGVCRHMSRMHLQATVMPVLTYLGKMKREDHVRIDPLASIASGKFVLVFVKGELVGAVKMLGAEFYEFDSKGHIWHTSTPTFLSLRNVVDANGRLTLAMGGVYEVTRAFYDNVILPEVNRQGPFNEDDVFDVHYPGPQTRKFLLKYRLGMVNVPSLKLYTKTFLLNDNAFPENAKLFENLYGAGISSEENRELLWREILKSLETVRAGLQADFYIDPKFLRLRKSLNEYKRPDVRDAVAFDVLED